MVMSVDEAANMLGCKTRQIFHLLKRGILLRAPRYGRSLRIYKHSVEKALSPPAKRGRKQRVPSSCGWEIEDIKL